ncbi:hypothetical protein ACFQFC_17590 [Amorphoplanes digitatis]|uniref:Uncharacterized protein n=1 Tax=Actinoplanes digitatis TaxID=1868 RepID=A0A7W7MT84_9ACTN|nr:hypothetical protein [Actinoplanes digitatis]MBB4766028.1 hypothetical protein [Actinoplanes digitatis]
MAGPVQVAGHLAVRAWHTARVLGTPAARVSAGHAARCPELV